MLAELEEVYIHELSARCKVFVTSKYKRQYLVIFVKHWRIFHLVYQRSGVCVSGRQPYIRSRIADELNSHGCGRFHITFPLAMSTLTRPPHQRGRSQTAIEAQQSLLGKSDRSVDYASLLEDDLDSLGLGEQVRSNLPPGSRWFDAEITTFSKTIRQVPNPPSRAVWFWMVVGQCDFASQLPDFLISIRGQHLKLLDAP